MMGLPLLWVHPVGDVFEPISQPRPYVAHAQGGGHTHTLFYTHICKWGGVSMSNVFLTVGIIKESFTESHYTKQFNHNMAKLEIFISLTFFPLNF